MLLSRYMFFLNVRVIVNMILSQINTRPNPRTESSFGSPVTNKSCSISGLLTDSANQGERWAAGRRAHVLVCKWGRRSKLYGYNEWRRVLILLKTKLFENIIYLLAGQSLITELDQCNRQLSRGGAYSSTFVTVETKSQNNLKSMEGTWEISNTGNQSQFNGTNPQTSKYENRINNGPIC